jgi:hypothetical protein
VKGKFVNFETQSCLYFILEDLLFEDVKFDICSSLLPACCAAKFRNYVSRKFQVYANYIFSFRQYFSR